jgi:hypothetical protein
MTSRNASKGRAHLPDFAFPFEQQLFGGMHEKMAGGCLFHQQKSTNFNALPGPGVSADMLARDDRREVRRDHD